MITYNNLTLIMKNDQLLHKWINEELTPEELDAFKQRPEYNSLVNLYKNTENIAPPVFNGEQMLSAILKEEKINSIEVPSPGRRVFIGSWFRYAAAASVILIAGWLLFFQQKTVNYSVDRGHQLKGTLPDQSTFQLNAESTLTYDENTWQRERTLHLKGEAFFTVQKGSTFTVRTPNGLVQVLGTKFNVWSRKSFFEVQCTHGTVAVKGTDGNLIKQLNAFDAIRIEKGKEPEIYQLSNEEQVSWLKGLTRLRKVSLGQAIAAIERQFDVRIKTGGISLEEIISCNFQHDDLELALKTTLSPLSIQYEILNEREVLLKH